MSKTLLALLFLSYLLPSRLLASPSPQTPCAQIIDQPLCEEIGQMLIVGFGDMTQNKNGQILWNDHHGTHFKHHSHIAQDIKNNHIGGVILFLEPFKNKTGEIIRDRNIQNPIQVAKLNQDLQNFNTHIRKRQNLIPVPLFISIDQEGGRVDRLPSSHGFPVSTIAAQTLGTQEERVFNNPVKKEKALKKTYQYAQKLAQELADLHFNVNFAPVVDINLNPTNPIIGRCKRSFSANPQIVTDQAQQFIKADHQYHIIPVLKHFPGHGSSIQDSHLGLVDVTTLYQKEKELFPYQNLIQEGYDDMIMTAHVINGQIDKTQCHKGLKTNPHTWCPGTLSYQTLTALLKQKMGFQGLIVSDDITMKALTQEYPLEVVLKKGIQAGIDMFILSNNHANQTTQVITTITKLIKSGQLDRTLIDQAYHRIVHFKKLHILHKN